MRPRRWHWCRHFLLVPFVVLAVVTAAAPANASAAPAGADLYSGQGNRAGGPDSTPCVLEAFVVNDCSSTDPVVTLNANFEGNATGCTFQWDIDWGDGTPVQLVTVPGGPAGPALMGMHTYAARGSYTITATDAGVTGGCSEFGDTYQFTLLAPTPTSTSVACSPGAVSAGAATTCTATVEDTAATGARTPTGAVSFTSSPSTGVFGSSGSCTLAGSATTAIAFCHLTFTPSSAGTYSIIGSYSGDSSHGASRGSAAISAAQLGPPTLSGSPTLSGATNPGDTLTCSRGTWTGNPTGYSYSWYRNGTLLAGFSGSTYTLGTLDEGTTLACGVTATNSAGSASATSNAVTIPVPKVPHCPAATGSMTGTTIGQIKLGMTRSRARYLYRHHSNRGKKHEDFFCLTPIGVRVGYASPILLKSVPKRTRAGLHDRVVWASTSNPYYSLDGIRAGESIATASRAMGTEPPFHIGLNYWYLARRPGYTAVLKVRGSVVQELGIADNSLTQTRKAQDVLMHSFY